MYDISQARAGPKPKQITQSFTLFISFTDLMLILLISVIVIIIIIITIIIIIMYI